MIRNKKIINNNNNLTMTNVAENLIYFNIIFYNNIICFNIFLSFQYIFLNLLNIKNFCIQNKLIFF